MPKARITKMSINKGTIEISQIRLVDDEDNNKLGRELTINQQLAFAIKGGTIELDV
jgi:hypothetical protein